MESDNGDLPGVFSRKSVRGSLTAHYMVCHDQAVQTLQRDLPSPEHRDSFVVRHLRVLLSARYVKPKPCCIRTVRSLTC